MTNEAISQLTAGTPPYPAGTLFIVSVPSGGGSYTSYRANYSDLFPTTKLEQLNVNWDSNTPVLASSFTVLAASQWTTATVLSATCVCQGGSFTAQIQINGVSVGGLGAINVSSTQATTAATGSNTLPAGNNLTVAITAPSGSPTNAIIQINLSTSFN